MEIDFLGLNSKQSRAFEEERRKKTYSDLAIQGADISLSLSTTSSSVNFEGDPLDFGESNNTWAASVNNMIPTCSSSLEKAPMREPSSLAFVQMPVLKKLSPNPCFLYDLNEKPADLRDMTEPTAEPALLTILYPGSAHVYHEIISEKAKTHVIPGAGQSPSASSTAEHGTRGYRYTPTVAMARRATLARFLEKRMHRLTSAKTSNLVAKSPDSQTWNVNVRCSKKNSTIRKPSDGK